MSFAPDCFHFLSPEFDTSKAEVRLPYRFDNGPVLEETLRFPGARLPLSEKRKAAFERALENLHLAAGVSYYKAGLAPRMVHYRGGLPRFAAAFFDDFYRRGLGEFAWRNNLVLPQPVGFPVAADKTWSACSLPQTGKTVVALGGGKDSLVALEQIREQGFDCSVISIGQSVLIDAVAAKSGLPHIRIEREISPELFKLNRAGAWNGHVPITGILAFVLLLAAVLYEFDTIVMANERSASSGNVVLPDGTEINHQYSKSFEFERVFRTYCQNHVLHSLEYFSLLRPWSELAIAEQFSRYPEYFDVFSSCNRNFKIEQVQGGARWCCNCPKCRFVFLILAPFLSEKRMRAIFGKNILNDRSQATGFDDLVGRGAHKPFECVGEERECLAAFVLLSQQKEWQNSYLVKRFIADILPSLSTPQKLIKEVMAPSHEHFIPARFRTSFNATQRA